MRILCSLTIALFVMKAFAGLSFESICQNYLESVDVSRENAVAVVLRRDGDDRSVRLDSKDVSVSEDPIVVLGGSVLVVDAGDERLTVSCSRFNAPEWALPDVGTNVIPQKFEFFAFCDHDGTKLQRSFLVVPGKNLCCDLEKKAVLSLPSFFKRLDVSEFAKRKELPQKPHVGGRMAREVESLKRRLERLRMLAGAYQGEPGRSDEARSGFEILRLNWLSDVVALLHRVNGHPVSRVEDLESALRESGIPLNELRDVLVDTWGHPYSIQVGRLGFRVRSAGEDGVLDTQDDIRANWR